MPCPLGHTDNTPKGHCARRSHCEPTCKTEQADQVDEAEISDENSIEDTEEEDSDDSITNWQTNNLNSDSSNTDASKLVVATLQRRWVLVHCLHRLVGWYCSLYGYSGEYDAYYVHIHLYPSCSDIFTLMASIRNESNLKLKMK